ncbi:MAG TPA: demethoxyubiquinone hydroxylase family protein [Caulobacteraceae bacterium]
MGGGEDEVGAVSDRALPPRPGPGAFAARLAEILRVDHAGELGAVHIYRGQRAVFAAGRGGERIGDQLAEMEGHEARHLARFEAMLTEANVRPTALAPLWRAAGFALGAATALIGEASAHACTEAVETVIEAHYAAQIEELGDRAPVLAAELAAFRQEELAHRDLAVDEGARGAPAYRLMAGAIGLGCRAAIFLSEKL